MTDYSIVIHTDTVTRAQQYMDALRNGRKPGAYLHRKCDTIDMSNLTVERFLESLLKTKKPMIFAESAVKGDGSDWNLPELSLLGDISIAVPVTVYDNGRHQRPHVFRHPFEATLLYTPGALLRSGRGHENAADWAEVVRDGELNRTAYQRLYERRLLPLFLYANKQATKSGKRAFITIPGLGCGQFAGPFEGRLGEELKKALLMIIEKHNSKLPGIAAIYYDPFNECRNERHEIEGLSFLVRPLLQGNEGKSQLCKPSFYEEENDDFKNCELFSCVAWDHVSWPGNDFYGGSRQTDDGVKAAATSSMFTMTGIEGLYNPRRYCYEPPSQYQNWEAVVVKNRLELKISML